GFLGGGCYLQCRAVNRTYQITQLVNGKVDGVGNRTSKVLTHRSLGSQVTIGKVGNLIEQTQNRHLVTVVLLGGFAQVASGFTDTDHTQQDNTGQYHRP